MKKRVSQLTKRTTPYAVRVMRPAARPEWWQRILRSSTLDRSVKITTMCTHLVVIVGGGASAAAFVWQTAEKASLKDDADFNGKWTDEGCVDCGAPALGHYVNLELTSEKGQISGVIDVSDPDEMPLYDETKSMTAEQKSIAAVSNYVWSRRYKYISLTGTRWMNSGTVQIVDLVDGKMVNYGRARITANDGVLEWRLIEGSEIIPKSITLYRLDDLPEVPKAADASSSQ